MDTPGQQVCQGESESSVVPKAVSGQSFNRLRNLPFFPENKTMASALPVHFRLIF